MGFGQSLRNATTSSPPQINLPDDCAWPMVFFCAVLHHRHDMVMAPMSVEDLKIIAILADKYNCTATIKHTATHWFNALSESVIDRNSKDAVLAAYKFDHAEAFARITNILVKARDQHSSLRHRLSE